MTTTLTRASCLGSSSTPEHYVTIMSFVDKDLLQPGCTVLTHNKSSSVVGVLQDDADPMVSVMKVDKVRSGSLSKRVGRSCPRQTQPLTRFVALACYPTFLPFPFPPLPSPL